MLVSHELPFCVKNGLFLPRTCRGPCVFILNIRSARDHVWEIGGSMFPRCVIFHRTVASPTLLFIVVTQRPYRSGRVVSLSMRLRMWVCVPFLTYKYMVGRERPEPVLEEIGDHLVDLLA